jgi:tetratricopeptide (TPR) repeat protein
MAARNNTMANMPEPVTLTGSRLGVEPVEICTLAIRTADSAMNRAASYNNRGVMLFAQGLIADALADFEEAINVDDTLGQAYVNRGYTLMALQRWADSIPAFDRGIALGSGEQAKAHFNRGIAHEELGHVREAYQDYMKAAELDPLWEEPKQELTRFTVRSRGPGG